MIKIQYFENKNNWKNLFGLLGDNISKTNKFLKDFGARGTNGLNINVTGIYLTYEDGIFSESMQKDILNSQKMKNCTDILKQNITYRALMEKGKVCEYKIEGLEKKLEELTFGLKEEGSNYKETKPLIDEVRAELDYEKSVKSNINQQLITTKADVDRMKYENETIDQMLLEVRDGYVG